MYAVGAKLVGNVLEHAGTVATATTAALGAGKAAAATTSAAAAKAASAKAAALAARQAAKQAAAKAAAAAAAEAAAQAAAVALKASAASGGGAAVSGAGAMVPFKANAMLLASKGAAGYQHAIAASTAAVSGAFGGSFGGVPAKAVQAAGAKLLLPPQALPYTLLAGALFAVGRETHKRVRIRRMKRQALALAHQDSKNLPSPQKTAGPTQAPFQQAKKSAFAPSFMESAPPRLPAKADELAGKAAKASSKGKASKPKGGPIRQPPPTFAPLPSATPAQVWSYSFHGSSPSPRSMRSSVGPQPTQPTVGSVAATAAAPTRGNKAKAMATPLARFKSSMEPVAVASQESVGGPPQLPPDPAEVPGRAWALSLPRLGESFLMLDAFGLVFCACVAVFYLRTRRILASSEEHTSQASDARPKQASRQAAQAPASQSRLQGTAKPKETEGTQVMQATSASAPAAPGQSSKEEVATATAVALPPPRGGGGAGGMASEANAVSSVAGTPLKAHVNPEFNGLINMFSPPARGRAGAGQSSSPPRGKPSKGRAMLDGSASPSRTPAPSTPASGAPRASQPTLESLRKLAGVSTNKQATPTPVKANSSNGLGPTKYASPSDSSKEFREALARRRSRTPPSRRASTENAARNPSSEAVVKFLQGGAIDSPNKTKKVDESSPTPRSYVDPKMELFPDQAGGQATAGPFKNPLFAHPAHNLPSSAAPPKKAPYAADGHRLPMFSQDPPAVTSPPKLKDRYEAGLKASGHGSTPAQPPKLPIRGY